MAGISSNLLSSALFRSVCPRVVLRSGTIISMPSNSSLCSQVPLVWKLEAMSCA